MVVLRREIGDVLRGARQRQGRTLRQVSGRARVSLGYLSEVERGQKEASSELLASICGALEVPMSVVLREVSERVAMAEGVAVPDSPADLGGSFPDELPDDFDRAPAARRLTPSPHETAPGQAALAASIRRSVSVPVSRFCRTAGCAPGACATSSARARNAWSATA